MFLPSIIYITKQTLIEIQNHCIKCYPMEACGFLVGSRTDVKIISTYKRAKNMSKEPNRYSINPYEYYILEQSLEGTNLNILGFYHSHPNGSARPSSIDKSQAWPEHSYLLVALTEDHIQVTASWFFNGVKGEFFEEQVIIK